VADGIGWLELNRPDKHHALSADMFAGLTAMLGRWDQEDDVRVVVVRGAGEVAFASGADIGELGQGAAQADAGQRGTTLVTAKPVIAMIHGYCIGGGLMVAMEADVRLAADDAVFAIPAGRLGAGYPLDSVRRLVALVGPGWASSLLLSAQRIDATTAARIGLVDEVVPKADLAARVEALAAQMAANAPLALAAAKASIAVAADLPGADEDLARAWIARAWTSTDVIEGREAFAAKRPPRFRGR